jgi:hypothetical protein
VTCLVLTSGNYRHISNLPSHWLSAYMIKPLWVQGSAVLPTFTLNTSDLWFLVWGFPPPPVISILHHETRQCKTLGKSLSPYNQHHLSQPCHFIFLYVPPHLQCSTNTSTPPQTQHTSCSQTPTVTTPYPPSVAALLQNGHPILEIHPNAHPSIQISFLPRGHMM